MFIYEVLLVSGILGLVAMSLAGFGHHGGARHPSHVGTARIGPAHHGGRLAHAGRTSAIRPLAQRGGSHPGGKPAPAAAPHGALGRLILSLLSPITLFAACLGAGAVGAIMVGWGLGPVWSAVGAGAGAVVFNAALVQPIMRLMMGFASEPAEGLAGSLMQQAEAVTNFDAHGEGLIRVLVDGQSVDVLARLTDDERRQGTHVVRGQTVRVEEVDTHRNRCTVSRL